MCLLHTRAVRKKEPPKSAFFRDLRLQTHSFAKTRSEGVTKYFPFRVTKQAHKIPHHDSFPYHSAVCLDRVAPFSQCLRIYGKLQRVPFDSNKSV